MQILAHIQLTCIEKKEGEFVGSRERMGRVQKIRNVMVDKHDTPHVRMGDCCRYR